MISQFQNFTGNFHLCIIRYPREVENSLCLMNLQIALAQLCITLYSPETLLSIFNINLYYQLTPLTLNSTAGPTSLLLNVFWLYLHVCV